MLIVGNHHLFADAKPFKDIAKHLIGCDLTDDVREMEETLTQILRDKVA